MPFIINAKDRETKEDLFARVKDTPKWIAWEWLPTHEGATRYVCGSSAMLEIDRIKAAEQRLRITGGEAFVVNHALRRLE